MVAELTILNTILFSKKYQQLKGNAFHTYTLRFPQSLGHDYLCCAIICYSNLGSTLSGYTIVTVWHIVCITQHFPHQLECRVVW